MKNNAFAMFAFLLAFVVLFTYGCALVSSTTYSTATLSHFSGFDFFTGTQTDEAGKSDGAICNWNPAGVTTEVNGTTYIDGSIYLWWSGAFSTLGGNFNQKHMGAVALSTITTVPSTWESGSEIWPLLEGHSYVVKCTPEGYAKIYVTKIDTLEVAAGTWEADVEYYYTAGTTFNQ
ncbi:MAG: hypothetical protein ABIH50_02320 [bacterium]